jgi:hypothetical protein
MRLLPTLAFAALLVAASAAAGAPDSLSPKGQWLAGQLDAMGVETKWIAGERIDWRSGLPNGKAETAPGHHTHCSAFVAAAADRLGVYILRPPEHPQRLLANAQFDWLAQAQGWRALPDGAAAQSAANAGDFVVAAYHSHYDDTPGHIAIVKPAARSEAELAADGPLVIQAGSVNSAGIGLREGFAGHRAAWRDDEVRFYAHAVEAR